MVQARSSRDKTKPRRLWQSRLASGAGEVVKGAMNGAPYAPNYEMDPFDQRYTQNRRQRPYDHTDPFSDSYHPQAALQTNNSYDYSGSLQQSHAAAAHHNLLVNAAVAEYNQNQQHAAMAALLSPAPAPYAYAPQPAAASLAMSQAVLDSHSPLAAAGMSSSLARGSHHNRQNSLDELLMLSPSLWERVDLNQPIPPPPEEEWLVNMELNVPGLSLEPLKGPELVRRLRSRMDDVTTRYIPCVDFLVQCQQQLRKGLAVANQKPRYGRRRYMSPKEFHQTYIENLPQTFYGKNQFTMELSVLNEAVDALKKLRVDALNSSSQGCEAVKNSFLGGMKEGESWGLRKWLSKHGNALPVCTDIECIIGACKELDKNAETTRKLADKLRPMAQKTLDRLKREVPPAYQERSTAHPFLPFFHRLEAALRAMADFKPGEEEVICLDDSDDEVVEVKPEKLPNGRTTTQTRKALHVELSTPDSKKLKADNDVHRVPTQRFNQTMTIGGGKSQDDSSSSGDSENGSIVEIIGALTGGSDGINDSFFQSIDAIDLPGLDDMINLPTRQDSRSGVLWPYVSRLLTSERTTADAMAYSMDRLVAVFDSGRQHVVRPRCINGGFWDGQQYADALRLFARMLRHEDGALFTKAKDDVFLLAGGPALTKVLNHSVDFAAIASSLVRSVGGPPESWPICGEGRLPDSSLSVWNMWNGNHLLQAIDLVLLNALAYGKAVGDGRSPFRSKTNGLRKMLWDGIKNILDVSIGHDTERRKQCTPTRRSETSGFVVTKQYRGG